MAKIEQLNNANHMGVKIKTNADVADLDSQNILPVVVGEFSAAATEFPICFIKTPNSEDYQVVALMGVERGENLFVKDGKWDAAYMPARYTHKPFGLVKTNEEGAFAIAIDMESPMIASDDDADAKALFQADGSETEFLENQKKAMGAYLEQEQITRGFAKELADKGLFVSKQINLNINGKKIDIDGVNLIDEEKLKEMSDEDFLDLRKRGMLPAIYTHLLSMRQMNNLIKRKAERMRAESE